MINSKIIISDIIYVRVKILKSSKKCLDTPTPADHVNTTLAARTIVIYRTAVRNRLVPSPHVIKSTTRKHHHIIGLSIKKNLLKPIWANGIQLWGSAKKTNIYKIQSFNPYHCAQSPTHTSTSPTIFYILILDFRQSPK